MSLDGITRMELVRIKRRVKFRIVPTLTLLWSTGVYISFIFKGGRMLLRSINWKIERATNNNISMTRRLKNLRLCEAQGREDRLLHRGRRPGRPNMLFFIRLDRHRRLTS